MTVVLKLYQYISHHINIKKYKEVKKHIKVTADTPKIIQTR